MVIGKRATRDVVANTPVSLDCLSD
jgi:hypothetical protein